MPIPSVTGSWKGRQVEFRPDRLVVSVKPGYPVQATLQAVSNMVEMRLQVSPRFVAKPGHRWTIYKFQPLPNASVLIPQLAEQIARDERIRYAEPSVIGHGHLTPNDPNYNDQWWPRKIGMERAWGHTTGDNRVLLAIVDSGISISENSPDHPDLSGPRYIVDHRNELPGYVGHDYVDGDRIPRDEHIKGHGTHVTGIAAAEGNNGRGVAGVNWHCPVYVARVIDECNHFDSAALKDAVSDLLDYARGRYERVVVNMSMGTTTEVDKLREMCEESGAFVGEVLLVCAAGEVTTSHTAVDWPAAFAGEFDFVISAGSTNVDDHVDLPLRDNYDAITIFAPGNDIYSTLPTYGRNCATMGASTTTDYGSLGGTSMAAPIISGVATLIWTLKPGYSASQLIALLKHTARGFKYTPTLRDKFGVITGGGPPREHIRLNAGEAVSVAAS